MKTQLQNNHDLRTKEINELHSKGYVILQANRSTNAPIGWKHTGGKWGAKGKWGYTEEMEDPELKVYKRTFNGSIVARGHCGFYLGHNQLCCIDLDTKKTTIEETTKLKDAIVKKLKNKVVVERTKSNGFHIYFRYQTLPNNPDFMAKGKDNWIELYYSKRFIACYLSATGLYKLEHGSFHELEPLTKMQHTALMKILKPYAGKPIIVKKPKPQKIKPIDEQTRRQIESYVEQIVEKGIDITGDNPKWFRIGKAFANALGEEGFKYFNEISQFSPKYNADTIKDDYMRFLYDDAKPRDNKITIATFFKYCSEAGLYDLKTLEVIKQQPEEKEFDLMISEKDKFADIAHAVAVNFINVVPLVCIDKKSFYIFKDTHWRPINERQVCEYVIDFVHRSTAPPKIARAIETLPYKKAILEELVLLTMVDALTPNTGNLQDGININMANGILHVDLKNGKRKLLEHQAAYQFTGVLPYNYELDATCPRFDAWLDKQLPNKDEQEAYYAFVASCLTKHKADIILLLAGGTSTGKSSLIEITRRLIGLDNSVPISAATLFSGKADGQAMAMQMENKLLAYDFDAQPFRSLEVLLKVAAQEPIMGWQMGVARRPVTNYGRLMLAMNPHNYSVFTPAVARRFITLSMDVKVVKDNSVIPAIYENELAGIFLKVLDIGMKHLIENNGQIKISEAMQKKTTDFHIGSRDSIRWFNMHYEIPNPPSDRLMRSTKLTKFEKYQKENPNKKLVRISITELHRRFKIWMEDVEGYPAQKIPVRKFFAQDLELIGVTEFKDAETNQVCTYLIEK
jgi:hypothetical protein